MVRIFTSLWNHSADSSVAYSIRGFLLSGSGSVISEADPEPSVPHGAAAAWPKVAFANQEYMVTWVQSGSLIARGMNQTGTFLTPATIVTSAGDPDFGHISGSDNQFLIT